MPRIQDQIIPGELAADYARSLGPTRYLAKNYAGKDSMRDVASRHFPRHTAATLHPSAAQLDERGHFRTAAAGFTGATPGEQAAYFQLAQGSGLYYYNWFMQRNLPELIGGKTWPELSRPNANRYDLDTGDGSGRLGFIKDGDELIVTYYDIELDPATWADHGLPGPESPFYIFCTEEKIPPAPYPPYWEQYFTFNPSARTRYRGFITQGSGQNEHATITFTASTAEPTACVLWAFGPDPYRTPDVRASFLA